MFYSYSTYDPRVPLTPGFRPYSKWCLPVWLQIMLHRPAITLAFIDKIMMHCLAYTIQSSIKDCWVGNFVRKIPFSKQHCVWKPQKKSHLTLRVQRATSTFWVDKSSSKVSKMVNLAIFLKTWSLQSNSVTRQKLPFSKQHLSWAQCLRGH